MWGLDGGDMMIKWAINLVRSNGPLRSFNAPDPIHRWGPKGAPQRGVYLA